MFPLEKGGQLAAWLDQGLLAAREFQDWLTKSEYYQPLMQAELDIVCYALVADTASASSERSTTSIPAGCAEELHLAMIELPLDLVRTYLPQLEADTATVTCLRSVLMKPEHKDWLPEITAILEQCASE